MEQSRSIHRKELEPLPKYNYRTGDHSIKEWFLEIEKSYLENHIRIKSCLMVKRLTLTKEIKILNYKWFYIYKFDKCNRFIKCKARLMAQGNQ